jgi:acetyl-CoA acetyltransferase
MQGREVVIVEAVRTPVGRGHPEKGAYRDVHPCALLGTVFTEVISRAGIEPRLVEDVLAGCVQQLGEQQVNIGRNAWLHAGLPVETPALTIDRQCGSAQQAVNLGATLIAAGVHDVVIGAGVEHMGHIPFAAGAAVMAQLGSPFTPELLAHHALVPQGLSAELIAEQWELSREECDRIAKEVRKVLRRSIETGGSSISDYVQPDGSSGAYQDERRVYGREGEPCPRCRTPIRRRVLGQRSSHYCPSCQS